MFFDFEHPRGGLKFKPMNLISVGASKLYLVEIFEKHLCFLGLKLWMVDYSFSDSDINKIINKSQ